MLILIVPIILFILAMAIAALASALRGRDSKSTNNALRILGMGGLVFLFFAGQALVWNPSGGYAWMVLAWYYPNALSVIGGILFLAIIPSVTLALAIAASVSERWLRGSRVAIRILSLLNLLVPILAPFGDEAGFVLFAVPFGIAHVCASFGFALSLGLRKSANQATSPTPPTLPNS